MTLKKALPLLFAAMLVLAILSTPLATGLLGTNLFARVPDNSLTVSGTVPSGEITPVMLACDGCSGGSGGPG